MHISKDDKNCMDAYQIVLSGLSAMIHQSKIGLFKECDITAMSILSEKVIPMLKINKQSKESLLNMMAEIKDVQEIGCYAALMHALYSVVPVS